MFFFTQVIHIPSRPGSASQDIGKKFKFSCSNFAQDSRQGITDCIQQPNSKDNRLSSMGMVEKKIAVMANDEAYEMTRNKMAQADQERKEVRYVIYFVFSNSIGGNSNGVGKMEAY